MTVAVLVCFARSGGTLLNRCLAALPSVVMMSEVNPLGGGWGSAGERSPTTIIDQARTWYGIDLRAEGFADAAVELAQHCGDRSLRLVIRDWSFVNFVPHPLNHHRPPNHLLTLERLTERLEITPFALVRDGIDVWISRGLPPAADYFAAYRRYAEALEGLATFTYEALCDHP